MRGGLKGMKRDNGGRLPRATTRLVKAIDRNIQLNQALWYLTEKMAELKDAAKNGPAVVSTWPVLLSLQRKPSPSGDGFFIVTCKDTGYNKP